MEEQINKRDIREYINKKVPDVIRDFIFSNNKNY